uniref:Uncharacterized protein n=1 Tax=Tanacetum cinerariifolium TaxID=118510 RepID=A0A6L2M7M2_TANCI|nr:hypothetical protein [Tanacetum cinerariifolium]
MADMTAPSGQAPAVAPPVRTDEEIVPRIRWVQLGRVTALLIWTKSKATLYSKWRWISQCRVAVCSSLRSLKSKRTIESRAKRSSKIISLGNYPIMLASSHTVKSKTDIKSPTHYPCGIARTSE